MAELRGGELPAPPPEPIPGPWAEAAEAAAEVLRDWRTAGPEAHERVLDAVVDAFERVDWDLRSDDDHPGRAPVALDFERAAHEPPAVFMERVAARVDRWAAEVRGGGYAVGDLRELVDADAGPLDELRAAVVSELVLARWRDALAQRVTEWERRHLARGVERLAEDLRRKRDAVSRIRNNLGIELAYAGFGMDWSEGLYLPGVWDALDQYAGLVESNPSLRRLADVLGRYEEARGRVELTEVLETRLRSDARSLRGGRSEVRGVHPGDELDRLTAGDLALLAEPDLSVLFYLRYFEKRLLTYEMEGREVYAPRAESPTDKPVPKARDKGPILLCLDTSGSMAGEPELVAKTLCLALLRVALSERRPCLAVSFSSTADLREQELTRMPQALPGLLRFLATSFRGGTDPVPALETSLRRLESTRWERADVLWVSDGIFVVPEPVLARVAQLKAGRDARFHVLVVGEGAAPPFADVTWRWSAGASFATGAVQLVGEIAARSR